MPARIVKAEFALGHECDAELFIEVEFAGGGRSGISLDARATARVVAAANVSDVADLIGRDWRVCIDKEYLQLADQEGR